jgi:ribosomal protein RSM22 (predicted rRNA methylase)
VTIPESLSTAIADATSTYDRKALATAAEQLSLRYRDVCARAQAILTSDLQRAAYLATRVPATYAAVAAVLEEARKRLGEIQIRSFLDLGGGPGTATWAAVATFPAIEEIALVERDPASIGIGQRLAQHSPHHALQNACWIEADLSAVSDLPSHDLVVLSYSLGELRKPEDLLKKAWAAARVALIIVEPGTPRGFNTVLKARRQLLASGARLAAPCPHEHECPMAGTKDWCHFAERLERSQLHRWTKSGTLGYEDEKYSYVVAAKAHARRAAARVVRHPAQHKGHIRIELCTPEGLKQQVVAKRDPEVFRRARKAEWGAEWGP